MVHGGYAECVPAVARRRFVIAALCLGAGLVGYELWPKDETRITMLVNALCTQLNHTRDPASLARTRQFLLASLLPGASLRIAEQGLEIEGAEQIADHAPSLLAGPPLTLALSSVEVRISGRLARVDADLTVSVSGSAEQRRELRRTQLRLSKPNDKWLVEDIEVAPLAPAQMEARP